jgi:hypothetical protein
MRVVRGLAVLLDPIGATGPALESRAWLVPLLLAVVLTAAASAAVGARVDSARLVLPKLEASGELAKASEREISEQVEQAQRLVIVAGVAKGIFGVPLIALLSAVGLWLMSWLLGGRARFVELFTVACLMLLPLAMGQGLALAAALRQSSLSPSMAKALVPSSLAQLVSSDETGPERARAGAPAGGWKRTALTAILELADFFHLWAALVLGLGFASATKLSRGRAIPIGILLYFLVVAAVTIGLPGIADGAAGLSR